MEASTDECDGNYKSKNITVHGNATIVKQKGPQLVYSAEQRKAFEILAEVCTGRELRQKFSRRAWLLLGHSHLYIYRNNLNNFIQV